MLYAAFVSLALGALGGIFMATEIFRGNAPPKGIAWLHGIAVVFGLGLLTYYLFRGPAGDEFMRAFILALLTASGGVYLASRHIRHKVHPRLVVALHGLLGITTLVLLAIAIF